MYHVQTRTDGNMAATSFLPPNSLHQTLLCADFLHSHSRQTATIQCSCRPHRVLITAPLSHAARLSPHLLFQHLRPVVAPTITVTTLIDDRIIPLRDALLRLHQYQVLACVSRHSIASVSSQLLGLCGNSLQAVATAVEASGVRIAALGAEALAVKQLLGRTADIIPLDRTPSGLVHFMQADPSLRRASILCPIPVVSEMQEPHAVPKFLKQLCNAEFTVTAVPAYEIRPAARQSLLVELAMLADIDAILISSTGEAIALNGMLTESERDSIVTRVKKGELVLAAQGTLTATDVEEIFSLAPVVSDNSATLEGVARVVSKQLTKDSMILPN